MDDAATNPHSRQIARALLVGGCLAGVSTYLVTPLASPDQFMLASDVYQHAGDRLLAGEGIYGTAPPDRPGYTYLYPPIVTILFVPHALLGSGLAAFALQTVLNVIAAVATAHVTLRILDRRGAFPTGLDRWLVTAFFLFSSYSAIQFINGQINLWLALAFAIGFDAVDRQRDHVAGVSFAVPAVLKVFPAIMGLWLVRLRAWRAVVAAIATGLGGLLLGAVTFGPALTTTYVTDVLLARFAGSTFEGRPTTDAGIDGVHRQLAAVWPGGAEWHTLIGVLLLGGLLVLALRRVDTPRQRDASGLATITAILLFLPLQPLYFPLVAVPLVLLLYTLPSGRTGVVIALGAGATMIHVDQESLALLFEIVPLGGAIEGWILTVSATAFRFILVPTVGLWLLLLGCVALQWRREPTARAATASQNTPG